MKIVHIEWIDAHTVDSWEVIEDLKKQTLSVCESVGWLIYEDKEKTIISHTDGKDTVCGSFIIPKRCIIKMTEIKWRR